MKTGTPEQMVVGTSKHATLQRNMSNGQTIILEFIVSDCKMGSVDKATDWVSNELREFLEQWQLFETHKDLHKNRWYSPKQQMTQTELTYVCYILPILVVVSFAFFICMVLIVKKEKAFYSYIFLIYQALFELLGIMVQFIPFFVVCISSEQNDYMPFQYCEVFRIFTVFISQSLYIISQWMKVFMTIQQFAIFYFSERGVSVVSKTKIVLCIVTVSCLFVPLTIVTQIDFKFIKEYERNSKTGAIEFYCKIVLYQIIGEYRKVITFVVKDFLPLATYIGFGAGLSYQIKKRKILRQQLQNNQNTDTRLDNLAKAVHFSSVVFIITSLPVFVLDFIVVCNSLSTTEIVSLFVIQDIMVVLSILKTVCHIINITAVVLVFLCLNRRMRQALIKTLRTLVPCHR
ncbi:unnamed protein product [Mytilus coruscus]|uniref:G-protein coupled receptors family 1 profile domain-containing protein n=1 Tax=Mytilus coruscus TaxID=42192 RepID=A0A6J8B007_MYTCO|nr:unnamed protein product [Mytilus coruscus]